MTAGDLFETDVEFEDRPDDNTTLRAMRQRIRELRAELAEARRGGSDSELAAVAAERDELRADAIAYQAMVAGVTNHRHAAAVARLHEDGPATLEAVRATIDRFPGVFDVARSAPVEDDDDDY